MGKNNLTEASNGLLNGSYLTSIGGNHKLNSEASVAYLKMVAAAKAEGVEWGVTDSYRTLETQKDLVKRKGLYSKGGLAAQPGTSNHGWGSAVDLNFKVGKGNALEWLKKNAGKYGFTNIPREPWHWEHKQSAKNMGANTSNTSNTTDDSQSSTHLDSDEGSSVGGDLLKGILSTNLGLDKLASGFAGVQENIIRIKQLMK
jgi:LAS superfamily LD-carboxypeptidase LdcB